MRLVITIPAYNEEETVGSVINSLPRKLDGISIIEILVLSDGSHDSTVSVAKDAGANRVVHSSQNQGLARTFRMALNEALDMGADIIVNIDADGQYDPSEMQKLINPILDNQADIVLGSRFEGTIEEMTNAKRIGNKFGTWVVKHVSGVNITDSATGYRAFSRHAALKLNIMSEHTYTQDTIIQAGLKKLAVREVPIRFLSRKSGDSRLVSSFFNYAGRSGITTARFLSVRYIQLLMLMLTSVSFLVGGTFGIRVILNYVQTGKVSPLMPSAVLAGFGLVFGLQLLALGLMSGLVLDNRNLIEEALYRIKNSGKGK